MPPEKKHFIPKLFEFRIRYNAGAGHSKNDSFHYYTAENAKDALNYHTTMMSKYNFRSQTISIERKDPYRAIANVPPKWIDESDVINNK
jgi:hypothetical protein